jgi:mono/diheme cytochrome c family protein
MELWSGSFKRGAFFSTAELFVKTPGIRCVQELFLAWLDSVGLPGYELAGGSLNTARISAMPKRCVVGVRQAGGWLALLLAFTLSCTQVPLEIAAPVVSPEPDSRASEEDLEAGRAIYVSKEKCARCHSPKPVYNYSAKDWKKAILPVMADMTKLKPDEYELLAAYVTAASHSRPKQ